MSLLVKICGLRDKRHVAVAMDAGAGALGFVFAESSRQIAPRTARTVSDIVPRSVKRVAVMRHPSSDEWRAVLEQFEPDVLQTDAEDFDYLEVPDSVACWPVYREGGAHPNGTGTYLYEGPNSGQGETVNWSTAAEIAQHGQMILAGGLCPKNVAGAVQAVRPFGVDVSSGVESTPGEKDPELIREFIAAALAAEKVL
ncbi:MAG: phosphoribosylanthranilate isomerase [Gammaproteobacteria bacterium]|nr:phosphoribosylanthranilate isomerase [Gammaproteobacteria bacterium]NNL52083.1 phosphoribosylanthranilate isomerase [Woeseiaceae bacterium]